jgi:hypothetical protein
VHEVRGSLQKDKNSTYFFLQLVQVAARSKVWVCGNSLAGVLCSNLARGHGFLFLVSAVCWIDVWMVGRVGEWMDE